MIINNPDVMLAQSPLSSLDLRSQSRFHVLYPLSSMFLSADIPCLDACIRAHGLSREGITSIGITHPLLCQLLFARTWTKNCWNHATLPLLHIRKNNQENSATLFLIIERHISEDWGRDGWRKQGSRCFVLDGRRKARHDVYGVQAPRITALTTTSGMHGNIIWQISRRS